MNFQQVASNGQQVLHSRPEAAGLVASSSRGQQTISNPPLVSSYAQQVASNSRQVAINYQQVLSTNSQVAINYQQVANPQDLTSALVSTLISQLFTGSTSNSATNLATGPTTGSASTISGSIDPRCLFRIMHVSGNISRCQGCTQKIERGPDGKTPLPPPNDLVIQHKEQVMFQVW